MTAKLPPIALAVFVLAGLLACNHRREALLLGHWQAVEVQEEGTPLEAPLEYVYFDFHSDLRYSYHSTLGYREAGRYHIESDLLFTTDTLTEQQQQKAVRIQYFQADSLVLEMRENDKERLMRLRRETPSAE